MRATVLNTFQPDAEADCILLFDTPGKSQRADAFGQLLPSLFYSASTLAACSAVDSPRGSMQSAPAAIGEIERPVAESIGCGLATTD